MSRSAPAQSSRAHRAEVVLSDDQLERLAALIAAQLQPPPASPPLPVAAQESAGEPELVSAAELAAVLGTSRKWIYEHRHELGALALGTGKRPRLRFDPVAARAVLPCLTSKRPQPPQVVRVRAVNAKQARIEAARQVARGAGMPPWRPLLRRVYTRCRVVGSIEHAGRGHRAGSRSA